MPTYRICEVAGAYDRVLDVYPDQITARNDNEAYVKMQQILTCDYDMGEPIWGTSVEDPTLAYAMDRADRTVVMQFEALEDEEASWNAHMLAKAEAMYDESRGH